MIYIDSNKMPGDWMESFLQEEKRQADELVARTKIAPTPQSETKQRAAHQLACVPAAPVRKAAAYTPAKRKRAAPAKWNRRLVVILQVIVTGTIWTMTIGVWIALIVNLLL